MRIPVIAYIVIITAMVISAAALMNNPGLDPAARALVFAGALLFYVSDIFGPPAVCHKGVPQPGRGPAPVLCRPVHDRVFHRPDLIQERTHDI